MAVVAVAAWILVAAMTRAQFVDIVGRSTWTPPQAFSTADIPLSAVGDLNGDAIPEIVLMFYSASCVDTASTSDVLVLIWWSSRNSSYTLKGYAPSPIFPEGVSVSSYAVRNPVTSMEVVPSRVDVRGRLYVTDAFPFVHVFEADPTALTLSLVARFQPASSASTVPILIDVRNSGYPVILYVMGSPPAPTTLYSAYEELENKTVVSASSMFPFASLNASNYYSPAYAVGDLNGDAYDDFLLVNSQAPPMFFLNARNASFMTYAAPSPFSTSFSLATNLESIVMMDWNQDGYQDVSLVGVVPTTLSLQLTNLRNLTFQSQVPAAMPAVTSNVRAAAYPITKTTPSTLNLLAFGTASNGTSYLQMFHVHANGTLEKLSNIVDSFSTAANVRLARTLIPLRDQPNALYDSILVLGPEIANGVGVSSTQYLAAATASLLALSADAFNGVQDSTLQFVPIGRQVQPIRSTSSAALSLNGDGCLDMFVQGTVGRTPFNRLYTGNCNGTFAESSTILNSGLGYINGAVLAHDLDLDGNVELYFSGTLSSNVTIGGAMYTVSDVANSIPMVISPATSSSVTVFRLDADALPDVALMGTTPTGPKALFYRNDGGINFTSVTPLGYSASSFLGPVAGDIAALPSDRVAGVDDLLAAGICLNSMADCVLFFSNFGNGSLVLNSTVAVFGFAFKLSYPAIAVGRSVINSTLVFMTGGIVGTTTSHLFVSNRNGTFSTAGVPPPAISTTNGDAVFVDLDLDSVDELIIVGIANLTQTSFLVYRQNATAFTDSTSWFFSNLGGSSNYGMSAKYGASVANLLVGNFTSSDPTPRPAVFVSGYYTTDCSMHLLAQVTSSNTANSTTTSAEPSTSASSTGSSSSALAGILGGVLGGFGAAGIGVLCCACVVCCCCFVGLLLVVLVVIALVLAALGVAVALVAGLLVADGAVAAVFLRRRKRDDGPDVLQAAATPSVDVEELLAQAAATKSFNSIPWSELRILRKLGSGAFGEVLLAEWSGVEVAVKSFRDPTPEAVKEFEHEALMMAKVSHHPNVVNLIGVSTHGGSVSLVMGLCTGGSLLGALEAGRLDAAAKTRLLADTAGALAFLHTLGIVHRDVAARNVLLDSSGAARLADLGMSRALEQGVDSQQTGSNVGPIRWMAPESIERRQYSSATDSYAFAMMMVEVWSDGRPPFAEIPGLADVAIRVVREDARPAPPDATPLVQERLMRRMWARDPAQRPSMAEACQVLSAAAAEYLSPPAAGTTGRASTSPPDAGYAAIQAH